MWELKVGGVEEDKNYMRRKREGRERYPWEQVGTGELVSESLE